jgi:pilus assembly protein FimV
MNTRIHIGAALLLGMASLALSNIAWALGLGDAKVQSFLDQPLEVEIQLLTQASDDLGVISAGLASAADYELIGASRNDISVPLTFSIAGSPGNASILVRSQLAVKNPVVRLIVEVNSPSGRMLREYTLFLDPATVSQAAPAPAVQPSAAAPRTPAPETGREPARPAAEPSTAPSTQQGGFTGANEYGPVQSGETLWRIAKDWSQGTGLSMNQAMVAIQRNNPQAFTRGNINLLQRGAILRMPTIEDAGSIPISEAIAEVRQQTAEFQMRQDVTSASTPLLVDENVAPQAVETESEPTPEQAPVVEPEMVTQTEPSPESEAESLTGEPVEQKVETEAEAFADNENLPLDFEPQLELVPPSEESDLEGSAGFEESEEGADASPSVMDLREELARKEEELINQQQQNTYLEQQLKELQSQVASSQEGVLDDQNLSAMEDRLRQERLAQSAEENKPWYSGLGLFWIGLLVIVAALAGWFMNRRGGTIEADSSSETLREIQDDAEDVLRVLDADSHTEPGDETIEQPAVEKVVEMDESDSDKTVIAAMPSKEKPKRGRADDEAELLDEESADPEIQLDLARAYISMGDREAARVILDEVVANGSDAQKAEATKMKNLL